jgi:hypothetical protein
MIEKTSAFKTSDGKTHPTIEEAQAHEIGILIHTHTPEATSPTRDAVLDFVMNRREPIMAILGVKARKRRAPNGTGAKAKRTRAAATNAALQDSKQ